MSNLEKDVIDAFKQVEKVAKECGVSMNEVKDTLRKLAIKIPDEYTERDIEMAKSRGHVEALMQWIEECKGRGVLPVAINVTFMNDCFEGSGVDPREYFDWKLPLLKLYYTKGEHVYWIASEPPNDPDDDRFNDGPIEYGDMAENVHVDTLLKAKKTSFTTIVTEAGEAKMREFATHYGASDVKGKKTVIEFKTTKYKMPAKVPAEMLTVKYDLTSKDKDATDCTEADDDS